MFVQKQEIVEQIESEEIIVDAKQGWWIFKKEDTSFKTVDTFNAFKRIARSYTNGQAFKAGILTKVQFILVLLSACIMSCSFVFYVLEGKNITLLKPVEIGEVIASIILPFLLAICVEAAIISFAGIIRTKTLVNAKLKEEGKQPQKIGVGAYAILVIATLASVVGGEMFFQKLSENYDGWTKLAFGLVALFVPLFQTLFELNQHNIQQFIKDSVNSKDIIEYVLEQQTDTTIAVYTFDARNKALRTKKVVDEIDNRSGTYVLNKARSEDEEIVVESIDYEKIQRNAEEAVMKKVYEELQLFKNALPQHSTMIESLKNDQIQEEQINQEEKIIEQKQSQTNKLDLALQIVSNNRSITDEELAKALQMKRPVSARFWRIRALEILDAQDEQEDNQQTLHFIESENIDDAIWRDVQILDAEKVGFKDFQFITKNGFVFKTFGKAYSEGELADERITFLIIQKMFLQKKLSPQYFRYVQTKKQVYKVIVEHEEVKKKILALL